MSDNTPIEWADATVNAVNGCSVLSPGCKHCYAMRLAGTRLKHHPSRAGLTVDTKAGPVWNGEVRLHEAALLQPLRWKRPRRIFWNAHGDLFHEAVPDEWIDRVFAVCALTPQHTHMILTKRPERMREYLNNRDRAREAAMHEAAVDLVGFVRAWSDPFGGCKPGLPLPNVWLGTSVEDQQRADERIPHLLATPAAVRFVSMEPLLGPVNLRRIRIARDHHTIIDALDGYAMVDTPGRERERTMIDWVILGGESGPGARPMHPAWARSLRDHCAAAGVPFFFKQWGEWFPANKGAQCASATADDPSIRIFPDDQLALRVGKKAAGRLLDGAVHSAFPERGG